jgi:AcrR family transcriptional regulator
MLEVQAMQPKIKEDPSEKILTTAFECLSTRGYANVSMRNIADEAGVALSQLTYYYKSKEKLFTEVISKMMHQYLDEIEVRLESAADVKEKTASLTGFFKELISDKPKLLRLFIDFSAQALWIPTFAEQVNTLFSDLAKVIERHMFIDTTHSISLRGYSAQSMARLTLGALFGTSIQIILASDRDGALEPLYLAGSLLG